MFSICNRTFILALESHSHNRLYTQTNTHIIIIHNFREVFIASWEWQKFATSYITIQSFVVGINVAIQSFGWRTAFFHCFVISWASFHSCCLHMCDKHSTKQSTKTLLLFFGSRRKHPFETGFLCHIMRNGIHRFRCFREVISDETKL